jgi:nucleotide-binding universal stress UspA family protein
MFKEILLPTDGSDHADEAVNCAVALAKKFGARLHLIHVIETPRLQDYGAFFALPNILEELRKSGEAILKETAKYIRESGLQEIASDMPEGYPADEILEYSKQNKIDLIVMGTHGRRGFNRVVLGSISEEIVRRSPVPVLTVRMSEDKK